MFNRKSKRRIISILLAMMMIFTMVPGVAFADDSSDNVVTMYPANEGDVYYRLDQKIAENMYFTTDTGECEWLPSGKVYMPNDYFVAKSSDTGIIDDEDIYFDNWRAESGTDVKTWRFRLAVDKGKIKKAGDVVITVSSVKNSDVKFEKILHIANGKLSKTSLKLGSNPDNGAQLTFTPNNPVDGATITWSSTDESIAKVTADGYVTGIKTGECYIVAEYDGAKAGCKVTITEDGVRATYTNDPTKTLEGDPLKSITLVGKNSKTGWLSYAKDGKNIDIHSFSDNTTVLVDDGNVAGQFVAVADGIANIYFYDNDGNLVEILPVTVTGTGTDADEDTWETYPGAQESGGYIAMIDPEKSYIQTDSTNDAIFENMITKPMSAENTEFVIELIDEKFPAGAGTTGAGWGEEAVTLVQSDEFKADYLDAVKKYISVVDADGNAVASAEDGLEITLEEIGEKSAEGFAPNGGSTMHMYGKVKITVTKVLQKNAEYKLVVDALVPTPGVHKTIDQSYNADYGKIRTAATFAFVTEKGDIADATVSDIADQEYTGSEIKPAVEVKDGDKVLVEGTDYTVEYSNNTEIGTATVTITGIGDYEGEVTKEFKIVAPAESEQPIQPEDPADVEYAIEIDKETIVITDDMKAAGLDTEEAVVEYMYSLVTEEFGYKAGTENTVVWDVKLMISLDGGKTWVEATKENFPEEGITVLLPYPEGTNGKDYDFEVIHMFSTAMNGFEAGGYEIPYVTETEEGLVVTVYGLSPFAITWQETTADVPADTDSQDKDDVDVDTDDVVKPVDESAQTGDESNMGGMFALMMAALLTSGAVFFRRREN